MIASWGSCRLCANKYTEMKRCCSTLTGRYGSDARVVFPPSTPPSLSFFPKRRMAAVRPDGKVITPLTNQQKVSSQTLFLCVCPPVFFKKRERGCFADAFVVSIPARSDVLYSTPKKWITLLLEYPGQFLHNLTTGITRVAITFSSF